MIDQLVKDYLTQDIRTSSQYDDLDWPGEQVRQYYDGSIEFTECNRNALLEEFLTAKKEKVRFDTLEIGVARISTKPMEETSTQVMLTNMHELDTYVGIDVDDKSFLKDMFPSLNITTMQMQSQDYEGFKTAFGMFQPEFDFIFVDGWHSINQVLMELVYVNHLRVGGVIGYHDTNYHPGPSRIIKAFNDRFSRPRMYCVGQDWGIGFVTKLR